MLLGGLPRLLAEIERAYEFSAPQPIASKQGSIVLVRGRLKPYMLKALTGQDFNPEASYGEQMPLEVDLTLARYDQGPRYFPEQITFYRSWSKAERDSLAQNMLTHETGGKEGGPSLPSLMKLEFLPATSQRKLDPSDFEFPASDAEFDDITQSCLQRLGL